VAVIGGLPFGVAQSVPEAFDRMRGHGGPNASALPELVRAASNHSGPWPTLSVWHGRADQTVSQSNAADLIEQWRGLHGVPEAPSEAGQVNGKPRRIWRDAAQRAVIEEYIIGGLAHGTPLDTGGSAHGEKAAPFMLEAGISSTLLISGFWGILRDQPHEVRSDVAPRIAAAANAKPATPQPAAAPASLQQDIGKTIEDALRSAGLMK
jgi:poly(3-hydroxybutyrate) depolymerase